MGTESTEATVGTFADAERARRTVRWLRRAGLHARVDHVGATYEVVVPTGPEAEEAQSVLMALEHVHEPAEPAEPTGWNWVRSRLLNLESVGMAFAIVIGAVLLAAIGIGLRAMVTQFGWLALLVVAVAGLVFFHFSGIPHSAVKSPRPYSHKHDITMANEQIVQYRLAWAREQFRKTRLRRMEREQANDEDTG